MNTEENEGLEPRSKQSPFSEPESATQSVLFSVFIVSLWFIRVIPAE